MTECMGMKAGIRHIDMDQIWCRSFTPPSAAGIPGDGDAVIPLPPH